MSCSDKRVIVTGATGLIGKELVRPLHDAGFEVYATTIDDNSPNNGVHWLKGNLFDDKFVNECMRAVKPTHLLNLAWATTNDYLSSDINYSFLQAGLTLARAFAENGGRRAVYAGTCFEYRFKDIPLSENGELDAGKHIYTFCKDALRRVVTRFFDSHGVSFGYGRIFFVFGNGESKTRLTGMVLDNLRNNRQCKIKSGPLIRDYMYTKDIAGAFSAFLASDVKGCVNICSGEGITIHDYVMNLATAASKPELIDFCDECDGQPKLIVGNNIRLIREVGYVPKWSIRDAVEDIIAYYENY